MRKKKGKGIYLMALLFLLAGIGYLTVTGIADSTIYHLQVAEAVELNPSSPQAVAIAGEVNAQEIQILDAANNTGVRFLVNDPAQPEKKIRAIYNGAIPDLFAPGAPVILEGIYQGPEHDFKVTKLNTLCPSKYEQKFEDAKAA